jgi:hypothetical protein
MLEHPQPPFRIEISPRHEGTRQFLWTIFDGSGGRENSAFSYATIREAKAEAKKRLQSLITGSREQKS